MKVMKLAPDSIKWCARHAAASVKLWEQRRGGKQYNHNRVDSNIIGVRGEVAAYNYLKLAGPEGLQVEPNFMQLGNDNLKGDILVPPVQLEIKSIRPHQWEKLGRMITPKQLDKYVRGNAVVIWAMASPSDDDDEVVLKGWNYAREVRDLGRYKRTICDNIWLEDEKHMHPMDDIFELFHQ